MKSKPEPGDLRERALRLLARREHSRAEHVRKRGQAGFVQDDIESLLDEFEKRNWPSAPRFAESYFADHRARAGSIKLAYDLRQRGVPISIVDQLLSDNQESELERARDVWKKKFGTPPTNAAEKAKHIRFMQSRGFTTGDLREIIGC